MSLRLTVRQRLLGAWERGNPGRRGCVKACEIQVLQTQKHVSETDLRCSIGLLVSQIAHVWLACRGRGFWRSPPLETLIMTV